MAADIGPLYVKIVAASGLLGGKAIALATKDGQMVGWQQSCVVESEVDDIATVTVRFIIDGKHIIFADND